MSHKTRIMALERKLKPKSYTVLYTGDAMPGVYYQSWQDHFKALYDGASVATVSEAEYKELASSQNVLVVRFTENWQIEACT